MNLDLHAAKSRQASANRNSARQEFYAQGAHLNEDKTQVIIPSPSRHPQRARLAEHGFEFHGGEPGAQWYRDVDLKYRGKVYSASTWLAWALKVEMGNDCAGRET